MHDQTIPYGCCQCGCGQRAPIARDSNRHEGRVKGKPLRFIHGHNGRGRTRVSWRAEDRGYETPCHIWQGQKSFDGYGLALVVRNGKRREFKVHRVVWAKTHGSIPDGLCVLHRCDVPACVNAEHLFLGTRTDNNADKLAKGRQARGERHASATLTEHDVRGIRSVVGWQHAQLAPCFNVSPQHIGRIRAREKWSHV